MTQSLATDSVSQDSSWADEFPPAELVDSPNELPPDDATHLVNPPANTCATCGEIVTREPGSRGRLPKYHPECRPSRKTSSVTGVTRTVRVSKGEQLAAEQTEQLLEQCRQALGKAVALLSLVDPYDAFVLHVNSAELLNNLRPVLMRFEWLRRQASVAGTGGSILGLILTVFTTALPILAHHNLIPAKKVAAMLINMPIFMLRLQERMAKGDDGSVAEELQLRVQENMRLQKEAQMRAQTVEDSPNGGTR